MMVKNIKKPKAQKKCLKRKIKFDDYKHSLEATQLENKISRSEKNNLNVDYIRKNQKEFIKTKN